MHRSWTPCREETRQPMQRWCKHSSIRFDSSVFPLGVLFNGLKEIWACFNNICFNRHFTKDSSSWSIRFLSNICWFLPISAQSNDARVFVRHVGCGVDILGAAVENNDDDKIRCHTRLQKARFVLRQKAITRYEVIILFNLRACSEVCHQKRWFHFEVSLCTFNAFL